MINVDPLPASYSWRGKHYPKGATLIPEDLAIALGINPRRVAEMPPETPPAAEVTPDPELSTPAPKKPSGSKRKRSPQP